MHALAIELNWIGLMPICCTTAALEETAATGIRPWRFELSVLHVAVVRRIRKGSRVASAWPVDLSIFVKPALIIE